jgi:hypothetical protein
VCWRWEVFVAYGPRAQKRELGQPAKASAIPGAQMRGTQGTHHLWENSHYFLRHPGQPPS